MSRLRVVGLYYGLEFRDNLYELRTPFEPLPPVKQSTHKPIEVPRIFIKPDIENLVQKYNAQNNLPVIQSEESKLSLNNTSPANMPQLEKELMSLSKLTPEKITKLQKNDTFYNNLIHHIHCNTNKNYFTDAMGILHKKP